MEGYHVFFDSLARWVKHVHKEDPVFCVSLKEDHPSSAQEEVRQIYGIIQLSQVRGKYVHHLRFLVVKYPSSDESQRAEKTKLLDEACQNVLEWLQQQGFCLIRQGFLSFPKDSRTLQTALPNELIPSTEKKTE